MVVRYDWSNGESAMWQIQREEIDEYTKCRFRKRTGSLSRGAQYIV
jgi:hypothetical protein